MSRWRKEKRTGVVSVAEAIVGMDFLGSSGPLQCTLTVCMRLGCDDSHTDATISFVSFVCSMPIARVRFVRQIPVAIETSRRDRVGATPSQSGFRSFLEGAISPVSKSLTLRQHHHRKHYYSPL